MFTLTAGRTKVYGFILNLALLLFLSNHAYADLNLTIENNTGATIQVSNTFGGQYSVLRPGPDIKKTKKALIPSEKITTLRDFLSMGKNEISFESPCSTVQNDVERVIWVSGEAKRKHVIEIYEYEFGAHIMADRPNCSKSLSVANVATAGCAGILGDYDFGNWAGILRLWQEGDVVKGTYGKTKTNTLTGSLFGNVLTGEYNNQEAKREGNFVLTFEEPKSNGSRTVTGTWEQTKPSESKGEWGVGKQLCP